MNNEYTHDYSVFIGRFQPLHNGHLKVMKSALELSNKLIILVGSSNVARCSRNPFTFLERKGIITNALVSEFSPMIKDRIVILPLNDYAYNDTKWETQVQKLVHNVVNEDQAHSPTKKTPLISLIGFSKDSTSYYLKKFNMWPSTNVIPDVEVSSTDIRNDFFDYDGMDFKSNGRVPKATENFLQQFWLKPEYEYLTDWCNYDFNYKKTVQVGPFPVQILCADSVVIQSGHILLIERAAMPGKGLPALPGGHVNPDETFREAAIRELKEETRIADNYGEMPPAKLASFIDDSVSNIFDDPNRSSRARVMTKAFLFKLPDVKKLYSVKGDDDAKFAKWYPIGELDPTKMFEDHAAIIDVTLGGSIF